MSLALPSVFDLAQPLQLTAALTPDLVLIVGAMILVVAAAWRPDSPSRQRVVGWASIVVTLLAMAAVIYFLIAGYGAGPGPIAVDNYRWMVDVVILLGTLLTLMLLIDDNDREFITAPETHVLVLLASSGMMLLAAARDLMIVFLGIELMSISVYALAGINRRSIRSAEGALKYFLLGAFSTAFLLYGIALVYGATGATNLELIGERALANNGGGPLFVIGIAMLLIGFGFKVATVPFHMWAPDVYDGSPSPITAYMAATVKTAAFAAFLRAWLEAFPSAFNAWHPAVVMLAIATMVVGNAIGLWQQNIKRMLAYSSIGHAGYLLVALAAGTTQGASALIFYLLIYTLATFGCFAVVSSLTRTGAGTVRLDELAGLWSVRPWTAFGMAVLMLALLGFPIFGGAGFFAKWYVIQAALQSDTPQTLLVVVLVLTTVISAGYYLYVIRVMFMRPRLEGLTLPARAGGLTRFVLVATVLLLLILGIVPDYVVRLTWAGRPQLRSPARVAPYAVGGGSTGPVVLRR
ncbi:MAG TPA: NADH-quinone oxidoreductase subunit N [Gemmatimonadaceae bacterium]|nr:NADH-quinone oxidoreductase subunit N [Gemmatimonadaceae bacterium]